MNVGILILALFLIGGATFAVFAIAASNQGSYTDSFGATSSLESNNTSAMIGNVSAPLTGAAGGLALVIAAFLIFIAAFFVIKGINYGGSSGGRR